MKRFLLAALFICCVSLVYAQKPTQDVLYLKNGGVVKGTVLPSAEGTIKIQTRDGSIFVYNSTDVESKKVEQITRTLSGQKILDFPKQSFGVRVGVSYALVSDFDYKSHGASIDIGGRYEHSISPTNRWYVQTGLDLQYVGTPKTDIVVDGWSDDYYCTDVKSNTLFLDIPMMISCKFKLGEDIGIAPSLGFSHRIGLWGTFSGFASKESDYREDNGFDNVSFSHSSFSGNKEWNRPTIFTYDRYMFNFKAGVDFSMKNFSVGLNLFVPLIGESYGGLFVFGGDLADAFKLGVSVGYNF